MMDINTAAAYGIVNATTNDLDFIYLLFEQAIAYQKKNNYIGWNSYDKAFIRSDIENGLLYKIIKEDAIVCIFSICLSDALIWREKEKGDAVYLHRVVVNPEYRGSHFFGKVLDWATNFARKRQLKYIRMDTWAANHKIIAYYKEYGFQFVENYTTPGTEDLPEQHRNLDVALLEYGL